MTKLVADIPLRVKLMAAMLSLVAAALLVIGVASALVMRSTLLDRVDEQLRSLSDGIDIQTLPGTWERANLLPSDYFIAVLDNSSEGLIYIDRRHEEPPIPAKGKIHERADEPYTARTHGTKERWRMLVSPRANGLNLVVGENLSYVDSTVDQLVAAELVIGVSVLLVVATLGVAIVRSSLRPLREIERTAAAIAAGDLTRRVPESDPETEIGRVAWALNTMLTQIEGAFLVRTASEERMRQFVADASHELRTPLTTIRGFAELYRQGAAREPGETEALLRRIEDEASRMGLLVDDLLLLARLDRERPFTLAPVELRPMAADAVAAARAVAPDREIMLEVDEADETGEAGDEEATPVAVNGDEPRLRQVLGNLLTNALTHTPPGTPVTVRLRAHEGSAIIEVADAGPGLTAEQAERVFERFYRIDKARTRQAAGSVQAVAPHSGSGLGLAIVTALVAAHGGTVSVQTAPGVGATFTVRLPLLTALPEQQSAPPAKSSGRAAEKV